MDVLGGQVGGERRKFCIKCRTSEVSFFGERKENSSLRYCNDRNMHEWKQYFIEGLLEA